MNKKGFVLMETLVVTIFTLFTFSILYNTIVPLLGRYNELTYYNDLDTTYDLYHLRKFLRNDPNYPTILTKNYQIITCNDANRVVTNQDACYNLFDFLGLDQTKDEVIVFKGNYQKELQNVTLFSSDVKNYLKHEYISDVGSYILLQNDGYISYLKF